ncbi:MAG: YggS family pyridoxal phosphate-dependent enzyme [Roseburia sp.]|nr:YggS family pyridoxal phosphate-dependent enzyme [Roseburia sp.]MCM1098080.1 YggS family pyridoxal phosphate-dependent enzyme [Ruminococcus flavefaciens]
MIRDNLEAVREQIRQACQRAGREETDVNLIAVSKTKPLELLREAYEAGARDFGENKVQELAEKMPQLPDDIRWHMIGHLQRNKVKYLVGRVYLIHSVDSLRLAEEISREAVKKQATVRILLEVNVAGEEGKYGVSVEEAPALAAAVAALPGIRVEGLMTVAPFVENPEDNRVIFRKLRQLSVDIERKNIDNVNMSVLSMGMTGDYAVAVEEGASYVRVGTGIFGQRDYAKRQSDENDGGKVWL